MNAQDFFAKFNSIPVLNSIQVDEANLLNAGKHIVSLGLVEPTESKSSDEYQDTTPQLKIRFYNRNGVFTRWFPLCGYMHFSKMSKADRKALEDLVGAENISCSKEDYALVTKDGATSRVVSEEAVAQCQKRLKDLLYSFQIEDSEIRDENGNASLEHMINALNARKEAGKRVKIGIYNDKDGRPQLSWVGRAEDKASEEETVQVPSVSDQIA